MEKPKCPARIPAKKTQVTPKEMPPLASPENQPPKKIENEPRPIELPVQPPSEMPAHQNEGQKPSEPNHPVQLPEVGAEQTLENATVKSENIDDVPFQISFVNRSAVDEKKTQISLYGQPPYYPYPAGVPIKGIRRKKTLIIVAVVLCIVFLASSVFLVFLR